MPVQLEVHHGAPSLSEADIYEAWEREGVDQHAPQNPKYNH